MARPRVDSRMTTTAVARELGMGTGQLRSWVARGALPPPSVVDKNGVRYFDQDWLEKAREIVNRRRKGVA
ncbi:MAG: MerR family transcriptional regulator [Gammaproteobacteria bacterium]|nr:MerR family transcriptional regulator [Gammaproteobacteria bacterium]